MCYFDPLLIAISTDFNCVNVTQFEYDIMGCNEVKLIDMVNTVQFNEK